MVVSTDAISFGSNVTLEIPEGETRSYYLKLTERPKDGEGIAIDDAYENQGRRWFVAVHVDGGRRADGEYGDLSWIPSIGRDIHENNWNRPNQITITAATDANGTDETYTFEHHVWDHEAYCPPHLPGTVTVIVRDNGTDGTDGTDDNGGNGGNGGNDGNSINGSNNGGNNGGGGGGDSAQQGNWPELSIDDVTVDEDAGSAVFTVSMSRVSAEIVTVAYATSSLRARTCRPSVNLQHPPGRETRVCRSRQRQAERGTRDRRLRVRAKSPMHADWETSGGQECGV